MEYWLWLRGIKGLGPVIEKRLLSHFKTPNLIYNANKEELMSIVGLGEVLAGNILSSRSLEKAYSILEETEKKGIKLLTYNDPLYPRIAKECNGAPTLLYYRGTIRENIEGVAIVGSRRCSDYGKMIAIEAADYLAKNNIPVISGMAKGIDSYSHTSCLKSAGYTIAFLGTGVDICYPMEHISLMEAIIDNGAVISEYPPNMKARSQFFPRRNLLIASWSKKILVVEAAEKSGALITADFAQELERHVLAPPHDIDRSSGRGSNRLIQEGASIYLNPCQLNLNSSQVTRKEKDMEEAIESEVAIDRDRPNNWNKDLSEIEKKILSCISDRPKTIEEISIELKIDQFDLIENISIMELEARIRDVSGGRYIRGA